jgi:uncharacterized protein (DUF488 family)
MRRVTTHQVDPASGCAAEGPAIFTLGYSTRTLTAVIELLKANSVDLLVDVRTVPQSRYNPEFGRDALAVSLPTEGIDYRHEADLGGLRRRRQDSVNGAWRNESFRGFADYMLTPQFSQALSALLVVGRDRRIALMCAEGNPFRCHRSLIADAIAARGLTSCEITSSGRAKAHRVTPFAHSEGQTVTYPPQ